MIGSDTGNPVVFRRKCKEHFQGKEREQCVSTEAATQAESLVMFWCDSLLQLSLGIPGLLEAGAASQKLRVNLELPARVHFREL